MRMRGLEIKGRSVEGMMGFKILKKLGLIF